MDTTTKETLMTDTTPFFEITEYDLIELEERNEWLHELISEIRM